jgi:hypothetical protein
MALSDMQHDAARLEQDEIAFLIGRNLPERMKREGFRKNAVVRRSILTSLGECVRP